MSDRSSGTGRSYSDKLADLHVFIVPLDLFLDKYRTAFNNIALESVSAGFVRVPPGDTVYGLRDHIEEQLGFDIIPEDFVYLRSVGRCMAVVKQNQERLLKIKDFLPPVAFSPEIFLLSGTHDSVARPASDASNVVVSTYGYTTAGLNSVQGQGLHLPNISQQHAGQLMSQQYRPAYQQQGMARDDRNNSQDSFRGEIYDTGLSTQSSDITPQQQDRQQNSFGREDYNDQRGISEMNGAMERRNLQDLTDNEPKPKQKSKKQKHKKRGSDSSDGNDVEQRQDAAPKLKTSRSVKFIQPEIAATLAATGPDGTYMAPPTPIPSGRVIPSPMHGHTQNEPNQPGDNIQSESDQKKVAKKHSKKKVKTRSRSPSVERTENDYNARTSTVDMDKINENEFPRTIADVENIEDRSKYCQFPSPIKKVRRPVDDNEIDSGIVDDYGTPPFDQDSLRRARGEDADDMFGQDFDRLRRAHGEDTDDMLGRGQGGQHGGNEDILNNGLDSDRFADGTAGDQDRSGKDAGGDTKKSKKKTGAKKTARKVENIEETLRIPNVITPPPITLPSKNRRDLEKDTASARDRKQQQVELLRGELRRAKNERMEVEKQREQFVRRAKTLQSQTLQKRNQAKNVWKKRFFDEKRKTQPLEEQVNRLRYEVDIQHKALMAYLEKKAQEGKGAAHGPTDNVPSENTNQRMLLVRMQHDVEELRRRVEETKMKLASEMKMRDQAQKELKQLREDLMEKKINVTLTKSQKSLQTLVNPENIAV